MSSKRKAAEVERLNGKRPLPPLHRPADTATGEDGEDEQHSQHSKRHVQHSPQALQHSTSNSPITSAQQRGNGTTSASLPSSPHTAPLPAELHTPPAIDDGLLASLTLSPLSSSAARRVARSTKPAVSVPSSPALIGAASEESGRMAAEGGSAKRSRTQSALPPVPLLLSQPATGSTDNADSPHSSLSSSPAAADGSSSLGTSHIASIAAPASVDATPELRSTGARAVSVDSAIRGMQTISLSSLSLAATAVQPVAAQSALLLAPSPPNVTPSAATVTSIPAVLPSVSTQPIAPVAVSLPLIRLTLNPSRVRRTSSNEAAQGNLKKHKRSLFSPTPNQTTATDPSPRTAGSSTTTAGEQGKDSVEISQQREASSIGTAGSIAEEPASAVGIARAASPATDAGSERNSSERDEEASVASVETAVSMSSYLVRSPISYASSSPSPSPSPSSSSASTAIRCEVCNKALSSAAQLADHRLGRRHQHMLLMRQSGGGFSCELCGKVFTCAADQEKHQSTERHKEMVEAAGREFAEGKVGVFALACELCGVTFTGLTQQRHHLEGKKHIAMARQHDREQKADKVDEVDESKEVDGQQRVNSKGTERTMRDGDESLTKKRKYGRASPAAMSQLPHHQLQQQPSPTPRHILPSSTLYNSPAVASPLSTSSTNSASSPSSSAKRAQQTIRYITPPPQSQHNVLPPFRISLPSSRSSGSAGSVGSTGEGAESDGTDRPRSASRVHKQSHSSQRAQQQSNRSRQQQGWEGAAEADDDTASSSSYSVASSHEGALRSPNGYASDASYPPTSFSASPPFASQPYPSYPLYAPPLPPAHSAPYGPPQVMPPAAFPSMLPPMYGFLSPSAAASLTGPVLPSHTPVTIMYPTELLLAQQYAQANPYAAYPPLYVWPTPPQPMPMAIAYHGAEEVHAQPVSVQQQQANEEQADEQSMAPEQLVSGKVTVTSAQRANSQAAEVDAVLQPVIDPDGEHS